MGESKFSRCLDTILHQMNVGLELFFNDGLHCPRCYPFIILWSPSKKFNLLSLERGRSEVLLKKIKERIPHYV